MVLVDYQESLTRLQRGVAGAYRRAPEVLNVPGRSAACKVDPNYYLALEPVFTEAVARWSASFPDSVLATLAHTGSLVLRRGPRPSKIRSQGACPAGGPPRTAYVLPVVVVWGGRTFEVRAAFLLADFVDRALRLYAGLAAPLPVSPLRIRADQRPAVDAFFSGLTPLDSFVFD